ncbi:hypothetical protein [Alkalibacillus aidingensis]|uniref:hypothetical protein n=1 Tax=Alkalibacillus aidingensis TaxID=2747607 RepID=UPI001660DD42|nr:hypothetical protein [Alkalibacillus aidingensis]
MDDLSLVILPILAVFVGVSASKFFKWWITPVYTWLAYIGFILLYELGLYGRMEVFKTIVEEFHTSIFLALIATLIRLTIAGIDKRRNRIIYGAAMLTFLGLMIVGHQMQYTTYEEVMLDWVELDDIESVEVRFIEQTGEQISIGSRSFPATSSTDVTIEDPRLIKKLVEAPSNVELREVNFPRFGNDKYILINYSKEVGRQTLNVEMDGIRVDRDFYQVVGDESVYNIVEGFVENEDI